MGGVRPPLLPRGLWLWDRAYLLYRSLFLLHLFNTEPVLPFQATTDAPLLLRPRDV